MTKFLYSGDGPRDYPSLGFSTGPGAILDGDLPTAGTFTSAPDANWAVYGGGSPETPPSGTLGIKRYSAPAVTPTFTEPTDGYILTYSNSDNSGTWRDPTTGLVLTGALSTAITAGAGGVSSTKAAGAVGNGVANDTTPTTTALAGAISGSIPALLSGTLKTTAELTPTSSIFIKGDPGATILAAHSGRAIYMSPAAVLAGTSGTITAGDTTITIAGAGWTTNQHAGKWVQVVDTNSTTRRVVSNTATVLTLEHATGRGHTAGKTVNFYTPIPSLIIDGLIVDRSSGSGANIVVQFVDNVELRNVEVARGGGNGISIYHASRVRLVDVKATSCTTFGIFVYNSDNVRVVRPHVTNWGNEYAVQLKDCRDAKVIEGRAIGNRTSGQNAFNGKCSGLNPSYDVEFIGCWATGSTQSDFEFTTITVGETDGVAPFSARNFKAVRCTSYKSVGAGFSVTSDSGSTPGDFTWRDCAALESGLNGFTAPISRHRIINCVARRCNYEGTNIYASDVTIEGGVWEDNGQSYTSGSSLSSEIIIQATAQRTRVLHPTFRRTAAGKTLRAVREVSGADYTVVVDGKILEEVSAYTRDYTFLGANSKALGLNGQDVFTGSATVVKTPIVVGYPGSVAWDIPSIAAAGTQTTTFTVTGATSGDVVAVGEPATLNAGVIVKGRVSSSNTVQLSAMNITAAAIDPASATFKVVVLKSV